MVECDECVHDWTDHRMVTTDALENEAPSGIIRCPVEGCVCLIVWTVVRPPFDEDVIEMLDQARAMIDV